MIKTWLSKFNLAKYKFMKIGNYVAEKHVYSFNNRKNLTYVSSEKRFGSYNW